MHRLLNGGSSDGPAQVWASVRGLAEDALPRSGQLDLLSAMDATGADVACGIVGEIVGRSPLMMRMCSCTGR